MQNKYVVLVGDVDTGTWAVAVNTTSENIADIEFRAMKSDGTPAIKIFTGDFVQI